MINGKHKLFLALTSLAVVSACEVQNQTPQDEDKDNQIGVGVIDEVEKKEPQDVETHDITKPDPLDYESISENIEKKEGYDTYFPYLAKALNGFPPHVNIAQSDVYVVNLEPDNKFVKSTLALVNLEVPVLNQDTITYPDSGVTKTSVTKNSQTITYILTPENKVVSMELEDLTTKPQTYETLVKSFKDNVGGNLTEHTVTREFLDKDKQKKTAEYKVLTGDARTLIYLPTDGKTIGRVYFSVGDNYETMVDYIHSKGTNNDDSPKHVSFDGTLKPITLTELTIEELEKVLGFSITKKDSETDKISKNENWSYAVTNRINQIYATTWHTETGVLAGVEVDSMEPVDEAVEAIVKGLNLKKKGEPIKDSAIDGTLIVYESKDKGYALIHLKGKNLHSYDIIATNHVDEIIEYSYVYNQGNFVKPQ